MRIHAADLSTTVRAVTLPSPEVVEHVRKVKGVPRSWECAPCQAGCGEIVFYPPDAPAAARDAGVPFAIVCSLTCGQALMGR